MKYCKMNLQIDPVSVKHLDLEIQSWSIWSTWYCVFFPFSHPKVLVMEINFMFFFFFFLSKIFLGME